MPSQALRSRMFASKQHSPSPLLGEFREAQSRAPGAKEPDRHQSVLSDYVAPESERSWAPSAVSPVGAQREPCAASMLSQRAQEPPLHRELPVRAHYTLHCVIIAPLRFQDAGGRWSRHQLRDLSALRLRISGIRLGFQDSASMPLTLNLHDDANFQAYIPAHDR